MTLVRPRQAILAESVGIAIQSGQQHLPILKEINLIIPESTIQLLMGASGSGKTTLLTILAGLLTPTTGSVYLLGQNINQMSKTQLAQFRLRNIGFIFQDFNLFPALTAVENVELTLNFKGIWAQKARQQAHLLLERVGLANQAERKPRDLSRGQQQRVAVARALTGNPLLIIADEPTAALDTHSGRTVTTLLRQLAKEQGCTVVIATHDPRILDFADRIAHLEDGILTEDGESIRLATSCPLDSTQ